MPEALERGLEAEPFEQVERELEPVGLGVDVEADVVLPAPAASA